MAEHWIERLSWPLLRESLLLMRVHRPIGTYLLMWPALWGVVAAAHPAPPNPVLLALFALGAWVMRSAGCVANDLADRNFDPHVARTKQRPLAAGRISVRAAVVLLVLLLGVALLLALQLNLLTLKLAVAGALLAVTYPLTKRIVAIPQFYMGAAFGWAAVMAWAATAGALAPGAWLLFATTLVWAAGYDTLYGMMDREDDLKIGVKSTAILFGQRDLFWVAILYVLTVLLLLVTGWQLQMQWPYYGTVAGAALHMVWQIQHARSRQAEVLMEAFLSNQWLGMLIGVGLWLG
ncbi:4-hydroxybenzoate octaprenyltransferase [Magnetococcus marinus MC-1]|uniref:4-hydroxybenzoate octaprenyltransferase n=1 Tax=Magnetococcus marinus (strain ATCC BAA-1437 / JCM 17883 / MC-1) TaxID=156889 RepID=A0L474_MAGMM|nr:4-hydroxybenzoate octaprenyltransferase [Magnetococcus marinus]ABK42767.1 4-hydroxybenzoate octaprenyltransferase [Magnetococcus marinus MC-1]